MAATPTMQDKAAIRQIIRDIEVAWTHQDGYAYARLFVEDAELCEISGFKCQGREAIADRHQASFKTRDINSRLEISIERVRFIRPDVAHVEIMSNYNNVTYPFVKILILLVLTKQKSDWRIEIFNYAGILSHPSESNNA